MKQLLASSSSKVYLLVAASAVVLIAVVAYYGCTDSSAPGGSGSLDASDTAFGGKEELFNYAVDNLNRLDQFDPDGMFEQISDRLQQLAQREPSVAAQQRDRLMETWPEAEILRQIINRLNQWVRAQELSDPWQADPMMAALPQPLAQLPPAGNLAGLEFSHYDGFALREVVWLRDVSTWARGERLNDVERAKRLFDWAIRNVQLEADTVRHVPQMPWETVFFGRGTAMERAWVFILLLRQQRIDAALLAVVPPPPEIPSLPAEPPPEGGDPEESEPPSETSPAKQAVALPPPSTAELQPWAVAVLSEGELYLFDPALGLPIPAPEGIKLDKTGQLNIEPATLRQVVADEQLLRRLDVEGMPPYEVAAADLRRIVALLEASPTYVARRMALLESRLPADKQMVLSVSPTSQAERFLKCEHVSYVHLWLLPYESVFRRMHLERGDMVRRLFESLPFYRMPQAPLYKGRLAYIAGKFTGRRGAITYYFQAQPSNRNLIEVQRTTGLQVYRDLRKRRPDLDDRQIRMLTVQQTRLEMIPLIRVKQDARYWQGVLAMQRVNYDAAINWFAKRTLKDSPGGPWTHGAGYNLARCYEASGQSAKAIETYRADDTSPSHHGNLLRAKWLEQRIEN